MNEATQFLFLMLKLIFPGLRKAWTPVSLMRRISFREWNMEESSSSFVLIFSMLLTEGERGVGNTACLLLSIINPYVSPFHYHSFLYRSKVRYCIVAIPSRHETTYITHQLNQGLTFVFFCSVSAGRILWSPEQLADFGNIEALSFLFSSFFFTDCILSPEVQIRAPTLQLKTYSLLRLRSSIWLSSVAESGHWLERSLLGDSHFVPDRIGMSSLCPTDTYFKWSKRDWFGSWSQKVFLL